MSQLISIRVCTRDKNGEEISSLRLQGALANTRQLLLRLAGGCEQRSVEGYWKDDAGTLHQERTIIVEGVINPSVALAVATFDEINTHCKYLQRVLRQASVFYTRQEVEATFISGGE